MIGFVGGTVSNLNQSIQKGFLFHSCDAAEQSSVFDANAVLERIVD